jgi:hypothetical protein
MVFALWLMALGSREVLQRGTESLPGWLFQFAWFGWPIVVLFGYVFGLVPAIATGVLAQWLQARPPSRLHLPAIAGAGFALSWAFAGVTGQTASTALNMAVCGCIASAVCALMSGRQGA